MNTNDKSLQPIFQQKEASWVNPYLLPFSMTRAVCELTVSDEAITDAEKRLERFAPFIKKMWPETAETNGLIESPLRAIPQAQAQLEKTCKTAIHGQLFLKLDSHLAVAGSIKARGGIYEVLKHAEALALQAGVLRETDSYEKFASEEMRAFFRPYSVQVGSTGNLGLSIGIMSAALGFRAVVHMSADAKQWKKDLLRSKGVEVLEYAGDYTQAVAQGRAACAADPRGYFVDDERSPDLFLGYAVAARRLQKQLEEKGISVDEEHPLLVYIPAGVGGAPGGISYGLKRLFGDNVHCFFCEPVQCPSVLLGIATQKFERCDVRDYGLSGTTHADGLACASPSGFVTRLMTNLLSGGFTVQDAHLYDYLRLLHQTEDIRIEPSSCAAFAGPVGLLAYEGSARYCASHGLDKARLANAAQIAWATGGRLVPEEIWTEYLETRL